MNRIDRLFGISNLLQSRKFTSANQIATKYNISLRTVFRDIKALNEQGIPVGFEANKGYFVSDGYYLPPVSFSMDEVNAFMLLEKLAFGFSDKSIIKHYLAALNKIRIALKPAQREQMEIMNNHIKFQVPERLIYDFEYLVQLQNAISRKEIIEIQYKNLQEEFSIRKIECIGLIYYAFGWHLIAWCHSKTAYRDFNIARIQKINPLSIPFEKKDHMQVEDYMKILPVKY